MRLTCCLVVWCVIAGYTCVCCLIRMVGCFTLLFCLDVLMFSAWSLVVCMVGCGFLGLGYTEFCLYVAFGVCVLCLGC